MSESKGFSIVKRRLPSVDAVVTQSIYTFGSFSPILRRCRGILSHFNIINEQRLRSVEKFRFLSFFEFLWLSVVVLRSSTAPPLHCSSSTMERYSDEASYLTLNIYNPVKRKELSLNLFSYSWMSFFILRFCFLTILISVTLSLYHPRNVQGRGLHRKSVGIYGLRMCRRQKNAFSVAGTARQESDTLIPSDDNCPQNPSVVFLLPAVKSIQSVDWRNYAETKHKKRRQCFCWHFQFELNVHDTFVEPSSSRRVYIERSLHSTLVVITTENIITSSLSLSP